MPVDLETQIIETMKASENAVKQAAKLIELLAQVDTGDALSIGEVWQQHSNAHALLKDRLEQMALSPAKSE